MYGRNLSQGGSEVVAPLNLTPGGILTGTVVAEPGNVTVPYATVSACPVAQPLCPTSVTTNASGVFWVAAPNGTDVVSVVTNLYLSNLSRIVSVPADSFVELGDVPVYGFGTVHGAVLGLPSGAFLDGANVSICSQFSPPGGCYADESVTADANGSFALESPPGLYFFDAALAGYNSTRFEFVLAPGENLNLGIVVLQADGAEAGTVVTPTGGRSGTPRSTRAPRYAGGTCSGASSGPDGGFVVVAPPGPNELTVSAPGYLDTVVSVNVVSGRTTTLGPLVLSPVPPDVFENVTGFVTTAASGAVLPGVTIAAVEDGARIAQSFSRQDGSYALSIRWGTVTLFVGIPGYRPANVTLVAHANLEDVNFSLPRWTYAVAGVAFDGGTGTVLAGVVVAENGTPLATSGTSGAYQLALPNGTFSLAASHPAVGPVKYGTIRFTVTVNGGSARADITVPRTVVLLAGSVVDAATGAEVPTASITVWTMGGRRSRTARPSTRARSRSPSTRGRTNLSVTAPGFAPANVTVSTGPAGTRATVALTTGTAAATGGSSLALEVTVGVALAVVAAVAIALTARQRARRPPAGERYHPPGEPVGADDDPPT